MMEAEEEEEGGGVGVGGGCITEGTSVNLQIICKEECLGLSAADGPSRLFSRVYLQLNPQNRNK